ncbi:ankyrin repeat domain-containing protein [Nonomuraea longispora]|uniref:ankyrin repeat domain-containing protein n=1 Tax=Nonomuraea longispora TaxID=1848320 RepID=UPI0026BF670A
MRAYAGAGVPVDPTNGKGDTFLMPAAYYGHAGTVTMLVTSGADPNRTNDRGQTPLASAVFEKELEVVKALVEAGADPHVGTPSAADTAKRFNMEEWATP